MLLDSFLFWLICVLPNVVIFTILWQEYIYPYIRYTKKKNRMLKHLTETYERLIDMKKIEGYGIQYPIMNDAIRVQVFYRNRQPRIIEKPILVYC